MIPNPSIHSRLSVSLKHVRAHYPPLLLLLLPHVTFSPQVSDDADADGVMAVARASATSLDFTYLDTFQG